MKRQNITLAALLAAAAPSLAQQVDAITNQLPGGDFEGEWVACVPWTGEGSNANKTAFGQEPDGWHIANVIGMGGLGKTQVGEQTEGRTGGKAVKLVNTANSIMSTQIVPGYVTLGTPWNTSKMGDNNDGGAFGGIAFVGRPDALSFYYKHTQAEGSSAPFSVVAYSWTGSTTQADVPIKISASNPPKETMQDRDRNITGVQTILGGAVTKSGDFQLVATINEKIETLANEWTPATIDFTYAGKKLTPEKLNVCFAAGDYFAQPTVAGDALFVDDVRLIYRSQLADLKINGKTINGFAPDRYNYTIVAASDDAIDDMLFAIETTVEGYAATASKSGDREYQIKVTNPDGVDETGVNTHTYHLHFVTEALPTVPNEQMTLSAQLGGSALQSVTTSSLTIEPGADEAHSYVTLNDLKVSIGGTEVSLGTVSVPTTVQREGGVATYAGQLNKHKFNDKYEGNITVSGSLEEGTTDNKGAATGLTVAIELTATTALPTLNAVAAAGAVERYNLQGQRVGADYRGVVIERQGGKATLRLSK